jgi:hypothetical protein
MRFFILFLQAKPKPMRVFLEKTNRARYAPTSAIFAFAAAARSSRKQWN